MAIINKATNNKGWWGCGEKGTPVHCWWECRFVQPLWKTVWNFLRKLKMELPFDLKFHCWDYILRTLKYQSRRTYAPQCSLGTMYNSQVLEATQVPISKWMDQKAVVHLHNGILFSRKKELLPFAAAWMEWEGIMLSEISQAVKDKYHMNSPKVEPNQQNKQASKI